MDSEPRILAEERSFIVLYKPAGWHGAPLAESEGEATALGWCAQRFPEVLAVRGRKAIEGGLLHRLDLGTAGLMLVARGQAFFDALLNQQENGRFRKDYRALCLDRTAAPPLPGFPPRPCGLDSVPCAVESAFRAFGPGRAAVRPVLWPATGKRAAECALDRGKPYRTELRSREADGDGGWIVSARLERGFRHQIRCHLAWLGYPLRGDALYGGGEGPGPSLIAEGLEFIDPDSGAVRRFSLIP